MNVANLPSVQALDVLCPLHLRVSKTGHVIHAAPTMRKLRPGSAWEGERLLEIFYLRRPREVRSMSDFAEICGRKLHLQLRDAPRTAFKGVALAMEDGSFVVNLSFGISILDAVRDFNLTQADFAATDMATEMLYLMEAKALAMDATRKLNAKLLEAKAGAEQMAHTDALTGLANRRAFDTMLDRQLAAGLPFALMHVDLDYFKTVNDTLGHAAGDQILTEVAEDFQACVRKSDMIARVGGDEFILLLSGQTTRAHLEQIGERIIQRLERTRDFQGEPCRISGSIGTVTWDGISRVTSGSLLRDADEALYASKEAGRGRHTIFDPHRKMLDGAITVVTEDVASPTDQEAGQ